MSNPQESSDQYEDLRQIVGFTGFNFARFFEGETDILEPQMRSQGFTGIEWLPGETDSFGPLTRVCHAVDKAGNDRWFIYG